MSLLCIGEGERERPWFVAGERGSSRGEVFLNVELLT